MPAGRPRGSGKYSAEIQEAADRYLDTFEEHGQVLPTIEGLARVVGVSPRTLHIWDREASKPDFFRTLGRLRNMQKVLLLEKGLTGKYDAGLAKMMLSVNHGMSKRRKLPA